MSELVRIRVAALLLLALIGGVASISVALYQKAFTSYDEVVIHSARAGLQMRPGTVVKIKGVDVGKIKDARPDGNGGANITLSVKPEMMSRIPSNVAVSLEQLTAFGNKAVVLTPSAKPSKDALKAGQTLEVDRVSVEASQLLDHLNDVITTIEPAKLNSTLTNIADAVRGQGTDLGETLDSLDDYFGKLNTELPTLRADFRDGSKVLNTYADATPFLLTTLAAASVTSRSIVEEEPELQKTLASVQQFSTSGLSFLRTNEAALDDFLSTLLPTSGVLQRYAPEVACYFQGMDKANRNHDPNWGGTVPGLTVMASVLGQGNDYYQNPDQLPDMSADDGPRCWGMPGYDGRTIPTGILAPFDKSLPESTTGQTPGLHLVDQPLSVSLFGPLASYQPEPSVDGDTKRSAR